MKYRTAANSGNIDLQISALNAIDASYWRVWRFEEAGSTLVLSGERSTFANCAFAVFRGVSHIKIETYRLASKSFSCSPDPIRTTKLRVNIGQTNDQYVVCESLRCYLAEGNPTR